MRILKYIFLLILLAGVAAAVFIATQRGDYEITESRIINSPRDVVYSYINEYRNWQDWISWEDSQTKFIFPELTAGKGASFSWEGEETSGNIKTIFLKENDSISQIVEADGFPGAIQWTFKDTLGKTKVTMHLKGKMRFMPKVYAALRGGTDKAMKERVASNLAKLDKTLVYEVNTYKINVDGVFSKPTTNYLCQTIISTIENMPRNMRIMMEKMQFFFKKNKMTAYGKPFVLYKSFNTTTGITEFSVCIPVKEEVFITPGSDITSGKLDGFTGVRTTLYGDYSHLKEAYDKARAYIDANHITETEGNYVELYKIGKPETKSPSKWVTEIYIPVQQPTVIQPTPATYQPKVQSEPETVTEPEVPAEEPTIP